ncbi:hypothetical protein ONZ45_g4322 [Pleurotus djamor]|nr:hypothetical protein ONZ45_g4322 [Pleurotus djamor]
MSLTPKPTDADCQPFGHLYSELLLGPLYRQALGYMFGCLIFGMLVVQMFWYHVNFPKDLLAIRVVVWVSFILSFAFTLASCAAVWGQFGQGWGICDVLVHFDRSWATFPPFNSLLGMITQLFFAWRIHQLLKHPWISILICFPALLQCAVSFYYDIYIMTNGVTYLALLSRSTYVYIWLIASLVSDLVITASMLYILIKARNETHFKPTLAMLSNIIKYTVEAGLITSVWAIVHLVLWAKTPTKGFHLFLSQTRPTFWSGIPSSGSPKLAGRLDTKINVNTSTEVHYDEANELDDIVPYEARALVEVALRWVSTTLNPLPSLMSSQLPILIVGAGPAGLISALSLAQNGIQVRIIDKADTFHVGSRGFGIQPRTFEFFETMGLGGDMHKLATPIPTMRAYKLPGGTVPVKTWDLYQKGSIWPDRPFANGACISQDALEDVLRQHLTKHKIAVELNKGLVAIDQTSEEVIATLATFTNGQPTSEEEVVRAQYLIGSDGGRGATRKLLGLTFQGETRDTDGMVWGDVQISGLTSDYWHIWGKPDHFTVMARPLSPNGDKFGLGITGQNFDPVELSDPSKAVDFIRRETGRTDLEFGDWSWISYYKPNMRMVNKFQEGRAFVVGDSAHVHSPTGGQGLNCSVQDASNLSWKLALVLKGLASPSLLATYNEERLPVITQMLHATTQLYTHTVAQAKPVEVESAQDLADHENKSGWFKWRNSALEMYGINYRFSSIVLDERDPRPRNSEDLIAHAYSGYEGRGSLCAGDRAPDVPGLRVEGDQEMTLLKLLKPSLHTIIVFSEESSIFHDATKHLNSLAQVFHVVNDVLLFKLPRKVTLAKLRAKDLDVDAMSRSAIESWTASTESVQEYDDLDDVHESWQRDRVLKEWTWAMQVAHQRLATSKTRPRIRFLKEELLILAKHADLNLSQTLDIFKLLTETYPRYSDSTSRDAVEEVGMELVRRDEVRGTPQGPEDEEKMGVTEQILGWMSVEVNRLSKGSPASSNVFVLLSWSCGIYAVCLKANPDFTRSQSWTRLVTCMALLFDLLLDSGHAKHSLVHSAYVRVRRAIRNVSGQLPDLLDSLISQSKVSLRPIPLLCTALDVLVRLKNVKDLPHERLSPERKIAILNVYASLVLLSKTAVPSHIVKSFRDFIEYFVNSDDLATTVIPTIEKALLRSPEISLSIISSFFVAYAHPLTKDELRRVLVPTISASKSSNAVVRACSVDLFKALMKDSLEESCLELAAVDLLALPKSSKSAGPDHRVALYSMLSYVRPSLTASKSIIQDAVPLLAKETSDAAISALAVALPSHLAHLLSNNEAVPAQATALIVKEMNNTKPVIRLAFCSLSGGALLGSANFETEAGLTFAKALLPAFENILKTIANNPLNASPTEGYIAVACLLGPIHACSQFTDSISKNATIQSLFSSSVKPSFLVWDKVYQKVSDPKDEHWLLKAVAVALPYFHKELNKSELFRTQLGLVFVHLAVQSTSYDLRNDVLITIASLSARFPKLTATIIRDALISFLSSGIPSIKSSSAETSDVSWNKHGRLSSLILSSLSPSDKGSSEDAEEALVQSLIIAHHELLCEPSRQIWIELCQKAQVDPLNLVNKHSDTLLKHILSASTSLTKYGFSDACYRAITTLTFISPADIVPKLIVQLQSDLDPIPIQNLTDLDFGVWGTPEGTTYIDVLATKKDDEPVKKGKGAKMAQWEADVRKSLANKKPANGSLSKQDQVAVQAQLEKEQKIRQAVLAIKVNLERGLHIIHSLVDVNPSEFNPYISAVAALLVDGALDKGAVLVGQKAFDAYMDLSKCCSDRLGTFKQWVGVASLRCLEKSVPEDLQAEPADALVIRVLYRLRTLSEQAPFDAATFSYTFPLIHQVFQKGGISPVDSDNALEQIKLALDFVRFHCGEFGEPTFPRKQVASDLLHIIKNQPKLAKEASSTLVDLGESTHVNVTADELDVLVKGTLSQESHIRNACLQTLQPFDLTDLDWSPQLWIACHDDDEQNSRLARHLWEDNGLDVPEAFLTDLLPYLGHDNAYTRSSTASAIAEAVETWPQSVQTTLETIQAYYREKAKILAPEYDEYGMLVAQSLERSDPWPARLAAGHTFTLLAPLFVAESVVPFFNFLVNDGALGDTVADVRREILASGIAVIDAHGASRLAELIAMFEGHLGSSSPATEAGDQIKEAVVILFGRVARHLDHTDPRIPLVVARLIAALKTPAEQVQIAVSDCLVPLVRLVGTGVSELIDNLFEELFTAPKYASRRGAAYGLAGVLKGTGLGGIKQYKVLARLRAATEDKKSFESRQGAMFAFETLSTTLGRNFEPYITFVLPLLLAAFGDSSADVREAAQDAARVIMGNLSGYGLKLILPSLLEGLEEKQWRTKKGSIELLGMMAYCSPKQLSLSLPIVIPQLTAVLTDSHAQVKSAANKSLKQFGEVISNPEIQSLSSVLLKAMVDPAKIPNALTSLLKTSFMHYIDHSSLALVVPIIERGLKERGADTKKKAAQIVGNLASLTDSKDFVPYLDTLLPLVHTVLVDPVPEARATAAKALGTLVERLGEVHFPDLVPGLLRILKADTSGVDRQGAAQGLSEVLSGLGMERLEGLLPDIITNAQSPRATVREGFMSLLVFLPATFGSRFQPHLPRIISPILNGIADTEDYVREAAMRAGRMVVTNYSNKAIDLLLPELEQGMFDPGWRIRQSSITLVGELLFKVSGISGKTEIDEEEVAESAIAESSRKALTSVLGPERRDRILSALYLVRQDSVMVVRQSSIHIWKALVHNTPRTVREILPELVSQIIRFISSEEFEQQEIAARTTTEICRKSGEKITAEIITILKNKSTSSDSRTREGVCLALCEVMESSSEGQRDSQEDDIITMVRTSLVDDEANVRAAAAKAFDILQEYLGAKAIDATIPTLLEALRQPGQSSGTALQALREVMAVRASTVFPVLIPTLTAIPMTVFNARALASLVTVAGNALSKRLTAILNAVVKTMEDGGEEELVDAVDEAIRALFASINDAEGLNTLMMILLGWAKADTTTRRASSYKLFSIFCEETELDTSLYRVDWVRQLVTGLEDTEVPVHTSAWNALDVFVKSTPKDELEPLVVTLRRSIEASGPPGYHVPGFSLPKGVAPMVPIIIAGLTTGSNEQRENAAYAIGDLVERTEESAIKPFVVPFTGPLIRVATQATTYPPAVKTGILSALTSMLQRIPTFVKPFFPQLQRTFVKSASDPASAVVRTKAAQALGVLMKHQPRVDPVVTELIAGARGADDAIASNLILSLSHVVRNASENVGEKAREACVELVADAFRESHDDYYAQAIADLFKALSSYKEMLLPIIRSNLLSGTPSVLSSRMIVTVLSPYDDEDEAHDTTNVFQSLGVLRSVAQKVQESVGNEKSSIARPAREARDLLKEIDDDDLRGLF